MTLAYPRDLAEFVVPKWNAEEVFVADYFAPYVERFELPSMNDVELIISTCYQSSLMSEEQRPVVFRVILGDPECFPPSQGPPNGLHRLEFSEKRKFSAHELRRLSPAASFHRALIGICFEDGLPKIWGFVHSGPRWLRAVHGGRGKAPPMPPALVINVAGPGRIEVRKGKITVGQLNDGRIYGRSMNVFASEWLHRFFEHVRGEHLMTHLERRSQASTVWADLNPEITKLIAQHMVKRVITAMRTFGHGGTLVILPEEAGYELLEKNPYVTIKYKFADGEPRARFKTLMLNLMDALAEYGGRSMNVPGASKVVVDWADYEASTDQKLAELDEAVFEVSHLIAGLTSVDGAVVMTKRFELLGFGAEIFCEDSDVSYVARAMDLEGTEIKMDSVETVGTRHRSAFRLCTEIQTAMAVVVSQDGSVHFVRWKDGQVTYWDHQATISSFDF
jgi:DisA bacterial checkpoint controller nucleotide-binding